ncbi:MAG TPA: ABC transporter permease [Acidimicrobiales bacterium]|nr:ABC transporter permease [Acidimicrobiales bacterium]
MHATIFTAVAAAALLTLPRALDQPLSGGAWLLVLAVAVAGETARRPAVTRVAAPVAGVLWLQVVLFPLPASAWAFGLVLGLMSALVALGMALVYRANRVLNFAQAELGTAPTVLVVGLVNFSALPWLVSVPIGLAVALALGVVVEMAVIRRFQRAPRLVLTVATIGLSQLLSFVSLVLPRLWGRDLVQQDIDVPWRVVLSEGPPRLEGDHLLALVLVPLVVGALAAFLRFTDVGVAIRAASERSDRAALLGIPVRRLQTVVWCLATGLSFLGVLLRAGVVGLPVAATLSFGALLAALAALVLGNLTDMVAVGAAAVAVGILEQGVLHSHPDQLVAPVLGGVIVVVMLVRRLGTSRLATDTTTSWQASEEVRPIPAELRRRPEVRWARAGALTLLGAAVVALPLALRPSQQLEAATVACFVLVAASVVVLTGWAGQVSLGQMSFAAVGALVGVQATGPWRLDLSLALLLAGAAGAVVAVVVGLPALRLRGPFLAVTTLAFAVASSQYLLNRSQVSWLPRERLVRPRLFAVIDLSSQRAMFWTCATVAVLGLVAVRGVRASRTGRVLLALRDNEAAARSYGIDVVRAKLSAFALSGFLAAVAGCLLAQVTLGYTEQPFGPAVSFNVFTAAVVGGLGSLTGAVIGALFLNGGRWVLSGDWELLPSALGVLLVLLVLPGGLGELVYRARDALLRRLADRRGLVVPSLVADVRTDTDDVGPLVAAAEHVPAPVAEEASTP